MDNPEYDAIVVGGGPAGSTAATVMAKDGRRVLVLEREHFPRYHIGESLLPATVHGMAKLLGVSDALERAGFVKKLGGTFRWGKHPTPWTFRFSEQARSEEASYAYQVERAKFDEILLRNAAESGAEVREGHSVTSALLEGERIVGVKYTDDDGNVGSATASYVLDASGANAVFQNTVGRRHYDPFFRNVALFGYFRGAGRLSGDSAGNIFTAAFDGGWCWYIPLSENSDLTSVGVVLPKENAKELKGRDLEQALAAYVQRCAPVADLLAGAERIEDGMYGSVRVLRDFSYRNERYFHNGGVLIGDAACFIDPVFSSGVHLATFAGLLAARSVNTALSGEIPEERCFREFDLRYRREFGVFYQFLMSFYDMHEEPESYFWSARKILKAKTTGREAFVGLVAGLGNVDERFSSVDEFFDSAAGEADVLRRVTEAKSSATVPSGADADLAAEMRVHTESLFRERKALLEDSHQATYADGLLTSRNQLRWVLPS